MASISIYDWKVQNYQTYTDRKFVTLNLRNDSKKNISSVYLSFSHDKSIGYSITDSISVGGETGRVHFFIPWVNPEESCSIVRISSAKIKYMDGSTEELSFVPVSPDRSPDERGTINIYTVLGLIYMIFCIIADMRY